MVKSYSAKTCRALQRTFTDAGVARPMRVDRYDAGTELTYQVTGVVPARNAAVRLVIDRFVGGGFAGQVYRVKVLAVDGEEVIGLTVGDIYAVKILVPPSAWALRFRNIIYWLGFQGPFAPQVDPTASRAGALWQKFIRRAAGIEFGTEQAVVDILATFVDGRIGSCGEISEWLDGRNWRFEADDNLAARRRWRVGQPIDQQVNGVGSPEYRAKKAFMAGVVKLLHQLGTPELARQYEWWTCKSQPNCLKRLDAEDDPAAGLTAVDFRAGLALLACLPMSPGDFRLILAGLFKRGSLVQFDRGDVSKLEGYVEAHRQQFADMDGALAELKQAEQSYRDCQIDVTHNCFRLLSNGRLWSSVLNSAREGWRIRNISDDAATSQLRESRLLTGLFGLLGILAGLGSTAVGASIVGAFGLLVATLCVQQTASSFSWSPLVGPWGLLACAGVVGGAALSRAARLIRAVWGRADLRSHYGSIITSPGYFLRAIRARMAEQLIRWHRAARVSPERAMKLQDSPVRFAGHLPLSVLPAGLHRFATDWAFARAKLRLIAIRPLRLYFDAAAREQWMADMLEGGLSHGMVTEQDARTIRGQLKEPFIQKYLKSLAVHVCTLPITQIVSVIVAVVYLLSHPELSWREAAFAAGGILVFFQVIPISPGSLVRGLYVLFLAIRERNYRDYKLALWMGFWKYIGYLSFPLQMAYRYPVIARFMAGRWATGAVHVLPVFGERGALAEHAVFDLFYNYPLTLRRQMPARTRRRASRKPRRWHVPICAAGAWVLICQVSPVIDASLGRPVTPTNSGWMLALAGLAGGLVASWLAGGAKTGSRVVMGGVSGLLTAIIHVAVIVHLRVLDGSFGLWETIGPLLLPAFATALLGFVAGAIPELSLSEPDPATDRL